MYGNKCLRCGAFLDPGEYCDCEVEICTDATAAAKCLQSSERSESFTENAGELRVKRIMYARAAVKLIQSLQSDAKAAESMESLKTDFAEIAALY